MYRFRADQQHYKARAGVARRGFGKGWEDSVLLNEQNPAGVLVITCETLPPADGPVMQAGQWEIGRV